MADTQLQAEPRCNGLQVQILVTSGVVGAHSSPFPLAFVVVLTTLSHYRASVR